MIVFPVYHIREHNVLSEEDGIIFVVDRYGAHILDNKNLYGETLGERRLRIIPDVDMPLYKLKRAFYDTTELAMHKKTPHLYIDSNGKVFERTKTRTVPLRYFEVIHMEVLPTGLLCKLKDYFAPVLIPYIPTRLPLVLGVLIIDGEPIFYETATEVKKDTWRKI